MVKLTEGKKLMCVPCGREVILSTQGISSTTIWCCGKPMKKKAKAVSKKKVSRK